MRSSQMPSLNSSTSSLKLEALISSMVHGTRASHVATRAGLAAVAGSQKSTFSHSHQPRVTTGSLTFWVDDSRRAMPSMQK
eukprot:CAMPEP_0180669450 /NCGR_PEP_ID=MMETSP1037_2-20121125/63490_1 /TAXON_ID=632150 /ORGANISM="Azadinium spinosum, Strain 3D9" /LENGTH=80 /DNA_ID=CAMNT_0022698297 /DNA_START=53 /DNA_END=292 /DNA_ORIENTATION=-